MPTREDVLAIRSIEEAFDLSTRRVTKRELALIRIASRGDLLEFTEHAAAEADDELVPHAAVWKVIERTKRTSKDLEPTAQRQVGINFERNIQPGRRIRVKVSWDRRHYTATVHDLKRS